MDRYLKMELCCASQNSVEVREATLKFNSERGKENMQQGRSLLNEPKVTEQITAELHAHAKYEQAKPHS